MNRKSFVIIAVLVLLYAGPVILAPSYSQTAIAPENNMTLAVDRTLILRPDGDVWANFTRSGGSANYEMVDEESHDSDGTTVYRTVPPAVWDRYTLEDHTLESGPIYNLTVYYYAKKVGTGSVPSGHGIADGSAVNSTSGPTLTLSYVLYSETYNQRPSGGAWTWSDVDDAEVLIRLQGIPAPATSGWITQVYVVVNYDGPPIEWHDVADLELSFYVLLDRWGLTSALTFLGLVMIPASGMYLVYGGRKKASMDKLFLALVVFFMGWGLLVGGIMP